jgi:hypothetical protein
LALEFLSRLDRPAKETISFPDRKNSFFEAARANVARSSHDAQNEFEFNPQAARTDQSMAAFCHIIPLHSTPFKRSMLEDADVFHR